MPFSHRLKKKHFIPVMGTKCVFAVASLSCSREIVHHSLSTIPPGYFPRSHLSSTPIPRASTLCPSTNGIMNLCIVGNPHRGQRHPKMESGEGQCHKGQLDPLQGLSDRIRSLAGTQGGQRSQLIHVHRPDPRHEIPIPGGSPG